MRCRLSLVLAVAALVPGAAAEAQDEPPVSMAQLPGKQGCLSIDDRDDTCREFQLPLGNSWVTISADGRNLYGVSAAVGGTLMALSRNPFSGALREQGCLSAARHEGCFTEPLIERAYQVTVSPDRSNVYVSSHPTPQDGANDPPIPGPDPGYRAVVVFTRDRTTGELARVQCVAEGDTPGCESVPNAGGAIVSPDGRHVYVGTVLRGAGLFDRDPSNGMLTNPRCPYALEPGEECPARPIRELSADGRFAYSWHEAITTYSRDPVTGVLTEVECPPELQYSCSPRAGEGYFSDVAAAPDGRNVLATEWFPERGWLYNFNADPATGAVSYGDCFYTGNQPSGCTPAPALDGPVNLEIAPDGHAVYVPSGSNWTYLGGVSTFARDPSTGHLSMAGCVTEDGDGGACVIGRAIGAARRVVVSPDSRNVYVMAPASIGVLGLAVDIAPEDLPVSEDGEVLPDLTCPAYEEDCEGVVALRTVKRFEVRRRGRAVKRRLTVGSRRYALSAGESRRVRIRLTRSGRRVVRRASKVTTRATVAAGSLPGRTVREIKLRARSSTRRG
jgi:6-phosphogluconolactonase (cycloisomerase 2 family)